jgi:hypothetical protein
MRRSHRPGERRPAAGPWSITQALEQDFLPWMLAQPARDAPHWRPIEERLSSAADAALDGFGDSTAMHFTTDEVQDLAAFHLPFDKLAGASWCYVTVVRALATTPYENRDRRLELMRELRTIAAEFQEYGESAVAAFEHAEHLLRSQMPSGAWSEPPDGENPGA